MLQSTPLLILQNVTDPEGFFSSGNPSLPAPAARPGQVGRHLLRGGGGRVGEGVAAGVEEGGGGDVGGRRPRRLQILRLQQELRRLLRDCQVLLRARELALNLKRRDNVVATYFSGSCNRYEQFNLMGGK